MGKYLNLDISKTKSFYSEQEYLEVEKKVLASFDLLHARTGLGQDYLGWIDLPMTFNTDEIRRIQIAAADIMKQSDILLVIGIGGSYLGAKSAIEMLKKYFTTSPGLEIIFVGHHISSTYVSQLVEYIKGKRFSINVISKSGTTTEPAIAFRIFKNLLEKEVGKTEARKRIYATTDKAKGALKSLADAEGYSTFVVPDDIGGRFSVLTSVGLLPIACSGVDLDAMYQGAKDAFIEFGVRDVKNNEAIQYALVRNLLHKKGKDIEILVNYEPCMLYFGEWWKQLFGESEGKGHKGIYVSSASFSTDLHSLGQMIQDGKRNLFETILNVTNPNGDITIDIDKDDLDGLNFLADKTVSFVNEQAFKGTLLAHVDGGVPNIILNIPEISAYTYGYLVYFFEVACGISAYTLGVNPFDQPGVEDYKRNMFALLGKPGYESLRGELEKKLK